MTVLKSSGREILSLESCFNEYQNISRNSMSDLFCDWLKYSLKVRFSSHWPCHKIGSCAQIRSSQLKMINIYPLTLFLSQLQNMYSISANKFLGNYSFLNMQNVKNFIQFSHYCIFYFINCIIVPETIQRGKLFKRGNCSRKYKNTIHWSISNQKQALQTLK